MRKLGMALAAASFLLAGLCRLPARAETTVYIYPALPGPATSCQWFDDNINDRSIDALIRQTDLLYNRLALPPGVPVALTGSATTQQGEQVVDFHLNKRWLCADHAAFVPEPVQSPLPSPAPR